MHTAIACKQPEMSDLCRRFGVARLELFGSAAQRDGFDPASSDADFLVTFLPDSPLDPLDQYFGLASALASLLGRPVDLVENDALTNPYLRAAIEAERELIFAA